jgi:hypothetical protein
MYKFIWLYFFPLPPIKLKLELQIDGWTTNRNPPSRLIRIRREQQSYHIYYTLLLWQVSKFLLCLFTKPQQTVPKCWVKTILLTFFFIEFSFAGVTHCASVELL